MYLQRILLVAAQSHVVIADIYHFEEYTDDSMIDHIILMIHQLILMFCPLSHCNCIG